MTTKKPNFEDCLEVIETDIPSETLDLTEFMGEDGIVSDDWKSHWKEMPEFVQEEQKPFKKLNVCFQTEEDFDKFRKLIGQSMTNKTKTIWFPEFDREANSLYQWIDDE